MTTTSATQAGKSWTIEDLSRALTDGTLTRPEVLEHAKNASIALPADFFAKTPAATGIKGAIAAASKFAPAAHGSPGAATRQIDLEKAAAGPKLEIPNPAPKQIKISNRLRLELKAQNEDMVAYSYYLKGKFGMFIAMRKYNPETALKFAPGLFRGKSSAAAFDRDGVVKTSAFLNNGDKQSAHDVMIADGLGAFLELEEAGIAAILATNQGSPGMSFDDKARANMRVIQQIADAGGWFSLIIMCPYLDGLENPAPGDVDARKPGGGMLLMAKEMCERDGVDLSTMVDDQVTGMAAADDAKLTRKIQITGPDGRAKDEVEQAKKKGHTLPEFDRNPESYLQKHGVEQAIAHLIATQPKRPMTKHAVRVAAPLAKTERTGGLPDAWLHTASAYMHRHAPMSSTYDLRVALHGADATAAMEAIGAGERFDAQREMLLVNFTDQWDLQANVYAFDVVRKTVRNIGLVESEELDEMLGWDGQTIPKRFEKAALLPVSAEAWDSGKRLAGFDDIAEYTPEEPIDFPALEQRRSTNHRPVMVSFESAMARTPRELGFYSIASKDDGKAVTITSGDVTHTIEPAPGTTFTSAGWSKRASIDQAILGVTEPRREGDGWQAAQEAISESHFGSDDRRPLLWLMQSDGVVRFVALSAKQETPAALEVRTMPLTVEPHPAG